MNSYDKQKAVTPSSVSMSKANPSVLLLLVVGVVSRVLELVHVVVQYY